MLFQLQWITAQKRSVFEPYCLIYTYLEEEKDVVRMEIFPQY